MNKIKEKLLKEIKHLERMKDGDLQLDCGLPIDKEVANKLFRHSLAERNLWELKAKLQQHEETSKAKNEEFIKILDKLIDWGDGRSKNNHIWKIGTCELNDDWIEKLEEIKQRIKEK